MKTDSELPVTHLLVFFPSGEMKPRELIAKNLTSAKRVSICCNKAGSLRDNHDRIFSVLYRHDAPDGAKKHHNSPLCLTILQTFLSWFVMTRDQAIHKQDVNLFSAGKVLFNTRIKLENT